MVRGLIVLVLVLTGWLAAPWGLIAPDFSQWRIPDLAASTPTTQRGAQPPRSMAFARAIEALIERAQIHAALIDLPFDPPVGAANAAETMAAPDSPPKPPAPDCGWLVHNAGAVDCSGNRLAALGVARLRRGLELDPIAAATNVTVKAADFGQARGAA